MERALKIQQQPPSFPPTVLPYPGCTTGLPDFFVWNLPIFISSQEKKWTDYGKKCVWFKFGVLSLLTQQNLTLSNLATLLCMLSRAERSPTTIITTWAWTTTTVASDSNSGNNGCLLCNTVGKAAEGGGGEGEGKGGFFPLSGQPDQTSTTSIERFPAWIWQTYFEIVCWYIFITTILKDKDQKKYVSFLFFRLDLATEMFRRVPPNRILFLFLISFFLFFREDERSGCD